MIERANALCMMIDTVPCHILNVYLGKYDAGSLPTVAFTSPFRSYPRCNMLMSDWFCMSVFMWCFAFLTVLPEARLQGEIEKCCLPASEKLLSDFNVQDKMRFWNRTVFLLDFQECSRCKDSLFIYVWWYTAVWNPIHAKTSLYCTYKWISMKEELTESEMA